MYIIIIIIIIIITIIIHPAKKAVQLKEKIANYAVDTQYTNKFKTEDWKSGTKWELSLNSLTKLTESEGIRH